MMSMQSSNLEDQVKQSFKKSLDNSHADYLDALDMQVPMSYGYQGGKHESIDSL